MADVKEVAWEIKSQLDAHEALGTEKSYSAIVLRKAFSVIEEQQAEIARLKAIINHDPDCANAEHDSGGCLGYSGSHDDEPIESCKKCEKYTGNTAKEGDGE